MARSRNIKPGFFVNEDLAKCGPMGQLLFAGLWTLADKEGRLEDRPARIKAQTLPYYDCAIDELLASLASHGFIARYQVESRRYIQIVNWAKHQTPHHKEVESTIPSMPQAWSKHEPSTAQACLKQVASCPTDSFNLIPDSLNSDSLVTASPSLEQAKPKAQKPGLSEADIDFPNELNTPEARQAVVEWIEHHRAIGKPYRDASAIHKLLKQWSRAGPVAFVAAVENSIANNYQGVFAPKDNGNGNHRGGGSAGSQNAARVDGGFTDDFAEVRRRSAEGTGRAG